MLSPEARIAQWYSAKATGGMIGVTVPAEARSFSLHHRLQIGSRAHRASHSMGNMGSSPRGKAAGV